MNHLNGRSHRRQIAASASVSTDRLPPHSTDDERAVLGCIMLSPNETIDQCASALKHGPETFYDLRHQEIYKAMLQLRSDMTPIDLVTLRGRLTHNNITLEDGYLVSLPDATPSAANLEYYLKPVIEKFMLRKMLTACTEAAAKIYEFNGDIDSLLDGIERSILGVRGYQKVKELSGIKELVREALGQIEAMREQQGAIGGLETGFIDLDKCTDGLHGGDMIVVSAFTSVGKSSFAMNVAEHVLLHQRKSVGVFTLEMTALQLVMRFICSHARVNLRNVRDGFLSDSDYPKLVRAGGSLSSSAIHFDDSSDLSIYQLRANARRMKQKHGIELFIVDYLQLLNANGGGRKLENRQQEVADISNGIKQMAKELDVPVLALSQLNDDGKLRESRAIGMDADGVWNLQRHPREEGDEGSRDGEPISLRILKNRNGPRDVVVPLTFLCPYTRFESAAKISDCDV